MTARFDYVKLNDISKKQAHNRKEVRTIATERMFEYKKLRGRIVEKYGTQTEFAKAIGISENSLSKKMNCITGISQDDIILWSELLDIDKSDFGDFFYS